MPSKLRSKAAAECCEQRSKAVLRLDLSVRQDRPTREWLVTKGRPCPAQKCRTRLRCSTLVFSVHGRSRHSLARPHRDRQGPGDRTARVAASSVALKSMKSPRLHANWAIAQETHPLSRRFIRRRSVRCRRFPTSATPQLGVCTVGIPQEHERSNFQ
jgi:hypothetical protein